MCLQQLFLHFVVATQLQVYPIQTSIVVHRDKFSDPTHCFSQR